MGQDLKIACRIVVAMFVAAELLSMSGVIPAPHRMLINQFTTGIGGYEWWGMFCAVLYVFSRPPRRELFAVAAGTIALVTLFALSLRRSEAGYLAADWVIFAAVGAGAASLIAWLVRIRRGVGDIRRIKHARDEHYSGKKDDNNNDSDDDCFFHNDIPIVRRTLVCR